MAHIAKYKAHSVGPMLAHYRRDKGSEGRENIDPNRTCLNRTIALDVPGGFRPMGPEEMPNRQTVSSRIAAADALAHAQGRRATRRDAVVMADLVITLPENVPAQLEGRFFGFCYAYMASKVGYDNLMGGFIHRDEVLKDGTPARDHMHVPFTPITDGRFNYKKMCPRSFYINLHRELGDYLEREMGFRPDIELTTEERDERVYTDKSGEIDAVRHALESKTADVRADLTGVRADLRESRAVLGGLRTEVSEKQVLAVDLADQISQKSARLAEVQASLDDFSEKEEAARQRLESVQGELREVESFGQKGVLELGALAAGRGEDEGLGERERAAGERNRELADRLEALKAEAAGAAGSVAQLEQDVRGLEGRAEELGRERDAAQGRVRGLERDRDGLAGRVERLRDAVRYALDDLVAVADGFFGWIRPPKGLEWVCERVSAVLTDFGWSGGRWGRDEPLAVSRDALGRDDGLGRGYEPPRSRGWGR